MDMNANSKDSDFLTRKSLDIVEREFGNPSLSVTYIADQLGFHPVYVSSRFKGKSGEGLLEYISKYYSLEESVIRGQQRIRDAVSARQIAMYLIRSMTNLSLDDIGKYFDNRDHSTVLYSIQQVEKKMKTDASFAEMVKEIKTNINSKR
jgi:hypothetical protein